MVIFGLLVRSYNATQLWSIRLVYNVFCPSKSYSDHVGRSIFCSSFSRLHFLRYRPAATSKTSLVQCSYFCAVQLYSPYQGLGHADVKHRLLQRSVLLIEEGPSKYGSAAESGNGYAGFNPRQIDPTTLVFCQHSVLRAERRNAHKCYHNIRIETRSGRNRKHPTTTPTTTFIETVTTKLHGVDRSA